MRSQAPRPDTEARAAFMAWAKAKGIPVREDHGWIVLEMSDRDFDPLLKVMADLLKGSA